MERSFTWQGRQMASANLNGTAVTYKYNADGLRTSKTVNGVTTEYYYRDGQLVGEKLGNTDLIWYRYDADGRLALVLRKILSTGGLYYYYPVLNTRGDIIELYGGPGALTARYTYDSWGKLISVVDANGATIGAGRFAHYVSLRYRGYYYDAETELYYLQSRYFDPEVGRFLNADDVNYIGITGTNISYNAFAYCENEPIGCYDPYGLYKMKTFSTQTWLTKLIESLVGAKVNKENNIVSLSENGVKFAVDVIAEKAVYSKAKIKSSVTYGKKGNDLEIEIADMTFDIVGGSVCYTKTFKTNNTSSAVIFKNGITSFGFGTSFSQTLPYNKDRMSITLTLRIMLEITHRKIAKTLLTSVAVLIMPKVLKIAKEIWNTMYKTYKGTTVVSKLIPALTKSISKI